MRLIFFGVRAITPQRSRLDPANRVVFVSRTEPGEWKNPHWPSFILAFAYLSVCPINGGCWYPPKELFCNPLLPTVHMK